MWRIDFGIDARHFPGNRNLQSHVHHTDTKTNKQTKKHHDSTWSSDDVTFICPEIKSLQT